MRAPHRTGAGRHGGRADDVDPQDLEGARRPDDVDDGVVSADLVEVHLIDRLPVQGCFDGGEGVETPERPFGHPRR